MNEPFHREVALLNAVLELPRERRAAHLDKACAGIQEVDIAAPTGDDDQLLAVSEALDKLAVEHKVEAELVKLRYFAGTTNDEAAEVLGVSSRCAKYYWTHARAWLFREIQR